MTQEEKELLLKDLCARLPYLPIVEISLYRDNNRKSEIELDPHVTENVWELIDKYHTIPYLRSLSSMTEEEKKEYNKVMSQSERYGDDYAFDVDWLNAHHFDYRGLIKRGLAIKVTKTNNPYKL